MKNFALIGVAGYIAPRHLQAIRDTKNNLVAALDKSDTVGVMDSYFPNADFFTEYERFDRHLDKLKRQGKGVDYVSINKLDYVNLYETKTILLEPWEERVYVKINFIYPNFC